MHANLKKMFFLFFLLFAQKALSVMYYTYNCPGRKNLVIGRAQYNLNTLQWSENFFVGVGVRQVILKGKDNLHMISFRNGDRFFYGKNYFDAYMIYAEQKKVGHCVLLSEENEHAVKLRVFRKKHSG
ncbi:hypothetical protein GL381_23945 [Salmonella enterica]|uniref:Uncharacterized protein n=1 Tax=Salmonella enterica TaxID=28901 RepID=A0A5Y2ZZ23_SALER|nr:hypothetical protein [Salmonella enterica]EAS0937141.1 hypothetical protein [Salmonella enterica]EAT9251453.1 hypothetical protein [Salmonella enterica]EAV9265638.1 hypothetical protein [Salmonella enterica]EAW3307015.1 hypothetical protein [Salmonella enterica]